jgi:putative CocE/NonD family hydrolase
VNVEMMRFFDYHLKGIRGFMDPEQPIHYWTAGTENWQSAKTWPPARSHQVSYYLGARHLLQMQPAHVSDAADAYRVRNEVGRGLYTRWDMQNNEDPKAGFSASHPDDGALLVYESSALTISTEVTGIPTAILYVESTAWDGQFFVYVEDVDPVGKVTYVTEGVFRALHRRRGANAPSYADPSTWHSFLRRDALPMQPGQPTELSFDLIPTSYLFRAGHRIRVALSGADEDHFEPLPGPRPEWRLLRDSSHLSQIVLPVISH